jgi:hypothetical protein
MYEARNKRWFAAVLALAGSFLLAHAAAADENADGFIFGRVKTRTGNTYQGFLRWGKEEACWGDHFNSTKEDVEYVRFVPKRERRYPIEIFGIRLGVRRVLAEDSKQFVARFGDIARIKVTHGQEAEVTMKSGTTIIVDGGSNDLEDDILVRDSELGELRVPWRKIDTIDFLPVPPDARPYATRLFGRVKTTAGEFAGFIQWDSEECLSIDMLDGDAEDGRLSIEFGKIRAIERLDRRSASVTLRDGRTIELSGSNDVDDDIRGIFVDDERFGRIKIPWKVFRSVEFTPAPTSGPSYGQFRAGVVLRGTVTGEDGTAHRGRIVFDIDEAESWEILDGKADDVDYSIPFERVASVEPRGRHASVVKLRNGLELRLEDSNDVSEDNSGVLIFAGPETEPRYLAWEDVRKIELD